MIAESSHCIYIENQFFCSAATPGGNSILKNGCAVPLPLKLTPNSVAQAIGGPGMHCDQLTSRSGPRYPGCSRRHQVARDHRRPSTASLSGLTPQIPAIPGFAGDVKSSGGTLAIMDATYKAICRGPNSIMGRIAAEGFDPHTFVQVFHLRAFDRLQVCRVARARR